MMMETEHVLPPITSSQMGVRDTASQICRGLSEGAKPGPARPREVSDQDVLVHHPVRTTLGELARGVAQEVEPLEDSGWDVGAYLKENVSQERKRGASLAAAVVRVRANGQSKHL